MKNFEPKTTKKRLSKLSVSQMREKHIAVALLGGVGVGQGDGEDAGILLCREVPVQVRQPGQSCNSPTAKPAQVRPQHKPSTS